MRFMTLWRPGKNANRPEPQMVAEMGKLIEEMAKAGVMVATGGWEPSGPCTMARMSGGKISVTDGPYAEAKEAIGGFCLLEVKSRDEALEWTSRFMRIAGEGTCEVRPLMGPPDER